MLQKYEVHNLCITETLVNQHFSISLFTKCKFLSRKPLTICEWRRILSP
nr:MAG TPA: hypothetical protein [Caudoviricetes sp.]